MAAVGRQLRKVRSMTSLNKIAKELNLKNRYGIYYGDVNGYVVSISRREHALELFIGAHTAELPQKLLGELESFLGLNALAYNADSYALTKTGLSVKLSNKQEALSNTVEFVHLVINQLHSLSIPGAELCGNCGKKLEQGVLVKVGEHVHICDEDCANKLAASKKKFVKKTPRHFFAGFIGAVMGSIIALAAWLYLSYFGYYSAPAAVLIPLLALLGYKLFGGKNCIGKAVAVPLISLINYALGAFGLIYYIVLKEWRDGGYIFTHTELLNTLISSFTERSELINAFIYNQLIAGAAFVLIGIIIVIPFSLRRREKFTAIL